MPKCCRKGGLGCDFKRQRIVKKNLWQKKWSCHGQTADYGPVFANKRLSLTVSGRRPCQSRQQRRRRAFCRLCRAVPTTRTSAEHIRRDAAIQPASLESPACRRPSLPMTTTNRRPPENPRPSLDHQTLKRRGYLEKCSSGVFFGFYYTCNFLCFIRIIWYVSVDHFGSG